LVKDPDPIEFTSILIDIVDKMGIQKIQRINFFYSLGEYLYKIYKFQHSSSIFEECVSLIDILNKDNELATKKIDSLNYIGLSYYSINDSQKAIEYCLEALDLEKRIEDITGESTSCSTLGNAYFNLGDFINAIKYYNLALDINKTTMMHRESLIVIRTLVTYILALVIIKKL
jgi:tetratricopeptide (TPR) repeat protein